MTCKYQECDVYRQLTAEVDDLKATVDLQQRVIDEAAQEPSAAREDAVRYADWWAEATKERDEARREVARLRMVLARISRYPCVCVSQPKSIECPGCDAHMALG